MRLSAGMCNFLAYDLDQSMGRILPKLPVIVHHILKTRSIFINIQQVVLHLINVIQCEKIRHANQHFNVNNFGYTCIGWYPTIIRGLLPIIAIPTAFFDMYRMWKEEDWIKDKLSIYSTRDVLQPLALGCQTSTWKTRGGIPTLPLYGPPDPFFVHTHTHTHKQRNYYKPLIHSGKWWTKEFSADICMCKMIVGR